jgi:hypothetical protein
MRIALSLAILLALGACGSRTKLQPEQGKSLPVAPYGAEVTPDSDALLKPIVQAVPERSVEKRKRSEERQEDPFDFPPAGK